MSESDRSEHFISLVEDNNIEEVKRHLNCCNKKTYKDAFEIAVRLSFLEIMHVLLPSQKNLSSYDHITSGAAKRGDLSVLKFIFSNIPEARCTYDVLKHASVNKDCLEYLVFADINKHLGCDRDVIDNTFARACYYGDIDLVRSLLPYADLSFNNCNSILWSARNGHIDVLKMLMPFCNYPKLESDLLSFSSSSGHIDVVDYLLNINKNQEALKSAITSASSGSRTDIVILLLEHIDPMFDRTQALSVAVSSCAIDIIDLLFDLPSAVEVLSSNLAVSDDLIYGLIYLEQKIDATKLKLVLQDELDQIDNSGLSRRRRKKKII